MGRKFSEFMEELREEARKTGTEKDLAAFEEHFRLARQLAQRRRAKGLSQKALSARTGIHQSEISRLEKGTGNPTLRTLSMIATALDGRVRLVFSAAHRASRVPARRKGRKGQQRRS